MRPAHLRFESSPQEEATWIAPWSTAVEVADGEWVEQEDGSYVQSGGQPVVMFLAPILVVAVLVAGVVWVLTRWERRDRPG